MRALMTTLMLMLYGISRARESNRDRTRARERRGYEIARYYDDDIDDLDVDGSFVDINGTRGTIWIGV